MNYKTLLLCIISGASVRNAYGMERKVGHGYSNFYEIVHSWSAEEIVISFADAIEKVCQQEDILRENILPSEFNEIAPDVSAIINVAEDLSSGRAVPADEVKKHADQVSDLLGKCSYAFAEYRVNTMNQNKKHWFFASQKECENERK